MQTQFFGADSADIFYNVAPTMSALYMDSSSLANSYFDQNLDAYVYSAYCWRRYLLAHYVCALRFL